ncbi:MAG: DNA primase family protein, partial [Planctomycetota bacterium]
MKTINSIPLNTKKLFDYEIWNTDLGNARLMLHLAENDIKYCPPQKSWYVWNGQKWEQDIENKVSRLASDLAAFYLNRATKQIKNGHKDDAAKLSAAALKIANNSRMSAAVSSAERIAPQLFPDEFDPNPMIINVKNGLLDLDGPTLLPHDKNYPTTKTSPVSYDPTATCPRWMQFLAEVFPSDPELETYFQQACGYTLTGLTAEQSLFFLYGRGQNGKSTAMNIIAAIMGDYYTKLTISALQQTYQPQVPTEIATLPGSRMVLTSEIAENHFMAENLLKDLVGGDTITARHLYGQWFSFRPKFKLWIYGNHKPRIKGTDEGIWRRIKLLPFTARILDEHIDPYLEEKLMVELPGILNWMIDGLAGWQSNGRLIEPPA